MGFSEKCLTHLTHQPFVYTELFVKRLLLQRKSFLLNCATTARCMFVSLRNFEKAKKFLLLAKSWNCSGLSVTMRNREMKEDLN